MEEKSLKTILIAFIVSTASLGITTGLFYYEFLTYYDSASGWQTLSNKWESLAQQYENLIGNINETTSVGTYFY